MAKVIPACAPAGMAAASSAPVPLRIAHRQAPPTKIPKTHPMIMYIPPELAYDWKNWKCLEKPNKK
jgi:hypothetical protein